MGWLRENWLDALIFFLFALVVAGIVLYLTGINPFGRAPERPAAASPRGQEVAPPAVSQGAKTPPAPS
ncbi:MAG: sporulation protein, partial [Thermus sp.]